MKKVICYGSATRDIFVNIKETKIIENKKDITAKKLMVFELGAKEYAQGLEETLGGGAVNMAASLAKLDLRPFVFARVSKGEDGKWIIKKMSRLKIKKNYVQQTGGGNSEISVIISDKKNRDHIILRTGDSVVKFNLEKALKKFREKVDWILISSQREGWQDDFKKMANFAKSKKAKIALNPSTFQIDKKNYQDLVGVMKNLEILFVNRDEALEIIKNVQGEVKDDIKILSGALKKLGVKVVVITDGEKGAYAIDDNGVYHLTADMIEKRGDTVGAGDAFASAFLASYIEYKDIQKALCWGIANSASVVSQLGGTNGILKKKEVKLREKKLIKKVEELQKAL